jgi:hypothetical protein
VEYEFRINGEINEVVTWTNHVAYTDEWGENVVTIVAVDRSGNASAPSNAVSARVIWGSSMCPVE